MYISRSTRDGGLQGWLRDGLVDLFLWFEGGQLVQAQLSAARDLAEWRAPNKLMTGLVREGIGLSPGAGIIDFDRRVSPDRLQRIETALQASSFDPSAKELALALLRRKLSAGLITPTLQAVQAAPPIS